MNTIRRQSILLLLFDCCWTLNSIARYSVDHVLEELCPIHASITVDVNFCEKFDAAINKFIYFIVARPNMPVKGVNDQLCKSCHIKTIIEVIPVLLERLESLLPKLEHDLLGSEVKPHNFNFRLHLFLLIPGFNPLSAQLVPYIFCFILNQCRRLILIFIEFNLFNLYFGALVKFSIKLKYKPRIIGRCKEPLR